MSINKEEKISTYDIIIGGTMLTASLILSYKLGKKKGLNLQRENLKKEVTVDVINNLVKDYEDALSSFLKD